MACAADTICVDLGANVGDITLRMAESGARVIAFEPDPWAVATLRAAAGHLDVEIVAAAAGLTDGTVGIYRHRDFDRDTARASQSTSTFAEHGDVTPDVAVTVRQIDLAAWLKALDAPVHILKIDIEGGEVALLERLLEDRDLLDRIGFVFAEMHDWIVPSLADRVRVLRRRTRYMHAPVFDLDWR